VLVLDPACNVVMEFFGREGELDDGNAGGGVYEKEGNAHTVVPAWKVISIELTELGVIASI
jgi:hypothetical protein